jgi:hypothetical protein
MIKQTQDNQKPGYVNNTQIEARRKSYITNPTARPQATPMYGICGHIARSRSHTCGSYNCEKIYGYGW